MGIHLVPVSSRTVVGNILVSVTMFNGDFNVFPERYGIGDVEAVGGDLPKGVIFVN